jgi:hypothetical protein
MVMQRKKAASSRLFETYNGVSKEMTDKSEVEQPRTTALKLPWPIEMLSPQSLRPAKRNARTHSKKQIRQIADSMARFGVINPVVADEYGQIVAGHARVEAARLLGLRQVPVIRLSHLSETEIRAYMLADNKLAEKAGWNREILAVELEELQVALPEIDVDVGITGFEPGEIDTIMLDFANDRANPADQIPDLEASAVAQTGDLFVLGRRPRSHQAPGVCVRLRGDDLPTVCSVSARNAQSMRAQHCRWRHHLCLHGLEARA